MMLSTKNKLMTTEQNPTQLVGKEISSIFSEHLLSNQPALDYLGNRGIGYDMVKNQDVGFCPPFLNYWFPLMRGRIVVPIKDVHGRILAFAGRQYDLSADAAKEQLRQLYSLDPVQAEKKVSMWDRGKWLNEPYPKVRHLFNLDRAKSSIRKLNYAILVEGYFDALVLYDNGFENTVAICSVSLSERHAVLLSRYCDRVILLMDGDKAGEKASEGKSDHSIIPCLDRYELKHHIIFLPTGYDPDDFVLKVGVKKLQKIINYVLNENKDKIKINLT